MAPLRWPGTAFALVVFASLASLGSVGSAQNVLDLPDQPTFVVPGVSPQQELRILVYGDMRFTDPSNTKSTNPRARKWLAEKVGTEHADAMLITGDIPFHGSNPQDWAVFEREASSWARGPRVYPTIGNHELRLDWRPGRMNWDAAFPQLHGNGFYSVLLGNVLIVNLNSTEPIWPRGLQADWLRTQLDHIPEQADFVILQMHIPLIADTQSEFIANIPSPESVVVAALSGNARADLATEVHRGVWAHSQLRAFRIQRDYAHYHRGRGSGAISGVRARAAGQVPGPGLSGLQLRHPDDPRKEGGRDDVQDR